MCGNFKAVKKSWKRDGKQNNQMKIAFQMHSESEFQGKNLFILMPVALYQSENFIQFSEPQMNF